MTATINGSVFFQRSGTFTTILQLFSGSGGATVPLQVGANTLVVTGNAGGCSAGDTRVIFYDPNPTETEKNMGDSPAACNGTNPINGATSNKFQVETDYQSSGSCPMKFKRYFNSKDSMKTAFGNYWRGSYSDALVISGSTVIARRATGVSYKYTLQAGAWKPDADISWQLSPVAPVGNGS